MMDDIGEQAERYADLVYRLGDLAPEEQMRLCAVIGILSARARRDIVHVCAALLAGVADPIRAIVEIAIELDAQERLL